VLTTELIEEREATDALHNLEQYVIVSSLKKTNNSREASATGCSGRRCMTNIKKSLRNKGGPTLPACDSNDQEEI
jgi:hypothetical protein